MSLPTTYIMYLLVSIFITVSVGHSLFHHGRPFLIETFRDENMADAVNGLLIVGFYLVNLGYITLALRSALRPELLVESIEFLASKIGLVCLILGGMHLINLAVFASICACHQPSTDQREIWSQPRGAHSGRRAANQHWCNDTALPE